MKLILQHYYPNNKNNTNSNKIINFTNNPFLSPATKHIVENDDQNANHRKQQNRMLQ
eukprot:UN05496